MSAIWRCPLIEVVLYVRYMVVSSNRGLVVPAIRRRPLIEVLLCVCYKEESANRGLVMCLL